MRIALTQRQMEIKGIVHDCLDPEWYRLFSPHEVVPIPNPKNMDIELDPSIDMLVITGGGETKERTRTELSAFNQARKRNLPILGICHGALFLNYLFDGVNGPVEGHRGTEHTILMRNATVYKVNSFHDMGIFELGKRLHPSAITVDNQVEAFKHYDYPIWGVLWHPERQKHPVLPPLFVELLNEKHKTNINFNRPTGSR